MNMTLNKMSRKHLLFLMMILRVGIMKFNGLFFQQILDTSHRVGISKITEMGNTTASFLLIQQARVTDSGNYACHSSIGTTAKATVDVIQSKEICQL